MDVIQATRHYLTNIRSGAMGKPILMSSHFQVFMIILNHTSEIIFKSPKICPIERMLTSSVTDLIVQIMAMD
jgi:hypothetical protein